MPRRKELTSVRYGGNPKVGSNFQVAVIVVPTSHSEGLASLWNPNLVSLLPLYHHLLLSSNLDKNCRFSMFMLQTMRWKRQFDESLSLIHMNQLPQ